ncbi:MAG: hypothetical protein WBH31_14340 [Promethearchaeia archaeon]
MIPLRDNSINKKEVKKTKKKLAENLDPEMILDYYKDWDSDKAPVIMVLDYSNSPQGKIESEDQRKMGYLWSKYGKNSK